MREENCNAPPKKDEPTVGASTIHMLVTFLSRRGVALHEVSPCILASLDQGNTELRFAVSQLNNLWKLALLETRDPALGLTLGASAEEFDMSIVGHLVMNSESLRIGLQHYIQYFSVVNEAVSVNVMEEDGIASMYFIHQYPSLYSVPDMERSLLIVLRRSELWLGRSLPLISVHFQHKAPDYAALYRRQFSCPVYFDQGECEIRFDARYLDLPAKKPSASLRIAALEYASKLKGKLKAFSLAEKVSQRVHHDLETREPDAQQIAKTFNMSKQTLYRRLKEEGVLFQKLVEQVRFNKARQLLGQSGLSASEVAFHLGFSELSAFSRAFKRWSGLSPKAYRDSLLEG